jgi:hypothetical protein
MKRLLGGVRQRWTTTGTVKKILSVTAVLSIAGFLLAIAPAQSLHAAPTPGNIPTSFKWLNRFYLVDNNGNNYFDNDTYDNKFEYQEQGNFECKNNLIFTHKGSGPSGDQLNMDFFYRVISNTTPGNAPNAKWDVRVDLGGKETNSAGQTRCVFTPGPATIDSNGDARRTTIYTNNNDQVVNIASGKIFSRKASFQGSDRYFRDDEVGDANNVCPDMIIKHPAKPSGPAESLFGNNAVAGSAMLFSVEKNANLNGKSESYAVISGAPDVNKDTCHIKADAINKNRGGVYAIAGYNDDGYDKTFEANGLNVNGGFDGGDEEDDSFIIFIGGIANMPKDATGNPVTTPVDTGGGGNEGDKIDERACKAGAIGWLVCPIVIAIQGAINTLRDAMQAFLTVNPLPIGSGPIYDSWNNIRNLSNIAFVLAFFAIIFSQATSIGISNYGIKRLLPRLVLIAIATNISYFVCSLLIDVFNILGSGITSLFAAVNNGEAGGTDATGAGIFSAGLVVGLTWALATGAIVEIFPLIIAAFFAFLITFLVLVLRQILIIFLIVVSPLAFVAGLLPGTQNWFRRWFDLFSTLLIMYPLIMGLFAAARLATAILSAAAGG